MMAGKPPPGHFRILYFASASSFTRKAFDDFPAPLDLAKLSQFLESKYFGMKQGVLDSCSMALNLEYIDIDEARGFGNTPTAVVIKEGDEVAIIPPVSSG